MTEPELFITADKALREVVDSIRDDQWSMKMPDWFPLGRTQKDVTLREIVNYHAYDDAWVPDVLAGKTSAEVGAKYDGDLLGEAPQASFAAIVEEAIRAVEACDDLSRPVHLSYGDFPAREYLKHISLFRGLRVHDIGKALGGDGKMSDALVRGLWDMLQPEAEEWRAMGVFGAAIAIPETASLQDRLLALTGRQP